MLATSSEGPRLCCVLCYLSRGSDTYCSQTLEARTQAIEILSASLIRSFPPRWLAPVPACAVPWQDGTAECASP
jgi:hypothetical protein